jgi:hypothetical protein
MTKIFSVLNKYPYYIILISIFFSSITHAKIFKWVDGSGQTHYSDTTLSVGNSTVETVKIYSSNITVGHTAEPIQIFEKEKLGHKSPKMKKQIKQNNNLYQTFRVGWGGKGPETDKKRCALARDVLNGAARHTNGMATDAHDIKVAQRDLGKFCH